MSVLSWGGPTIEFAELDQDGNIPEGAAWKKMPEIKNGTAQLNTEDGEKVEATDEDGNVVDTRTAKSKYTLGFQIFVKKGDKRPIEDEDGVIVSNYAVRLTPKDPKTEGFKMDKTSVSVNETWSAADGKLLKYSFAGLKPKEGKICKPYVAQSEAESEKPANPEQGGGELGGEDEE